MAKGRKTMQSAGAYGYRKGLLMLFGVVLLVLGIILYIRPELLELVLATVLVLYGLKKIIVGYRC